MQPDEKFVIPDNPEDCPVQELLSRFGDKWTVLLIVTLSLAPGNRSRFSELKKNIKGISQRMLTVTLRNLERDGLITREIFPEVPPRVVYELTELGKNVLNPMRQLMTWIEDHWPKIQTAREKFDRNRKQT